MVIAFTGHRTFDYSLCYSTLVGAVESLCGDGRSARIFMSGMADGFDLAAAEAVLDIRDRLGEGAEVELHAIIPYRGDDLRMVGDVRRRYHRVVERADRVVYLEDRYSHGVFYRRNDYLVDNADLVVAFYDRSSRGGTAYTVKRATKQRVVVENIYPKQQLELFAQ